MTDSRGAPVVAGSDQARRQARAFLASRRAAALARAFEDQLPKARAEFHTALLQFRKASVDIISLGGGIGSPMRRPEV